MNVLEAMDDVLDPTLGGPDPKPIVNRDELLSDDDDVPPDVTHELNRLKMLGRPYRRMARGPTNCFTHVWWTKAAQGSSPRCVGKMRCL